MKLLIWIFGKTFYRNSTFYLQGMIVANNAASLNRVTTIVILQNNKYKLVAKGYVWLQNFTPIENIFSPDFASYYQYIENIEYSMKLFRMNVKIFDNLLCF